MPPSLHNPSWPELGRGVHVISPWRNSSLARLVIVLNPSPGQNNRERNCLENPCLRFTKTTDSFYSEILGFKGRSCLVYFLSSLRARTAKTLICTKVGFLPIPERAPRSAQNRTFCALFTHFLHKRCGFAHLLVLLLESAETPLLVQIKLTMCSLFAVRALRLHRKYTKIHMCLITIADGKTASS